MRLLYRISFIVAAACLLLAGNFSVAATQQQESFVSAHFKTQQYSKAPGYSLNKDGEQVIPQVHGGSVVTSNGHSATRDIQLFFLPGTALIPVNSVSFSAPVITTRVQDFVPLFHLLLFPKHWFW